MLGGKNCVILPLSNTSQVLSVFLYVCAIKRLQLKALRNEPFKSICTLGVWQHGEASCKVVKFCREARELEGEELTPEGEWLTMPLESRWP